MQIGIIVEGGMRRPTELLRPRLHCRRRRYFLPVGTSSESDADDPRDIQVPIIFEKLLRD
jgi:hypothetical protein